jgi:hypothetical protein
VPDDVLRRIRDLAGRGYPLTKIANDLTRDETPLPSGRTGVWQPTQVRRVLSRAADYSSATGRLELRTRPLDSLRRGWHPGLQNA